MPTYLVSSNDLKDDLINLNIPPGVKYFTDDAKLMYTNLPTEEAIASIGKYIMENREQFFHLSFRVIRDALCIIMIMNFFTFGNGHWLQETGAVLETPPAPICAQTTFDIHEIKMILHFILSLLLYKRYIDEIIGIWVPRVYPTKEDVQWRAFKTLLNMQIGLE
eukprot:6801228-Ditylum_brightwellii.AAC.1